MSNPRNSPGFDKTFAPRLGGEKGWGYGRQLNRGWMFSQIKDHFEVNLLIYGTKDYESIQRLEKVCSHDIAYFLCR